MKLIGRRDFLASMSLGPGAYLLGSIFKNNLLPAAMGAATKRKNFLLLTAGQGFIEQNNTCSHRSETDFDLAPAYQPLAPYKSDMVIASKFYNPIDHDQHGNGWAFLTVMPSPGLDGNKNQIPGGATIDRLIGKQIGSSDAFPSLLVGPLVGDGPGAADGPRQPAVGLQGSVRAYDKFFGAGTPASIDSAQQTAVLDFISSDITKMNRRLAGPERAKMDQYLTSIRGLEQQILALARPLKCEYPATPPETFRKMNAMSGEEIDATLDVTFHAHLCGLTRVSQFGIPTGGNPQMEFLRTPAEKGMSLKDADGYENFMNPHDMQHRGDYPHIMRVDQWTLGRVALVVDRLKKTPDPGGGGGTMLDNSLVAYINYCGGIHHDGWDTYSVLTLGKAGGAIKTGRYLTYPERQHCISDVFTSWANAMDVNIDKFGDPNICQGPLPGLLGQPP